MIAATLVAYSCAGRFEPDLMTNIGYWFWVILALAFVRRVQRAQPAYVGEGPRLFCLD